MNIITDGKIKQNKVRVLVSKKTHSPINKNRKRKKKHNSRDAFPKWNGKTAVLFDKNPSFKWYNTGTHSLLTPKNVYQSLYGALLMFSYFSSGKSSVFQHASASHL